MPHQGLVKEIEAMNIGPKEAKEMLQGVDDVTSRTKKMIAFSGGDTIFIVWGIIWFIGGLGTHFMPALTTGHPQQNALIGILTGSLWTVLVAAGMLLSYRVGKTAMPTRSPLGKSMGLMWFLLYVFVNIWIGLLMPFIRIEGPEQSHLFWTHLGAIAATVPLFAYVVFGLFADRYMVWVGLAMTALMIAGVYLLEPWFYLWMAFVGGGGLAGTGVLVRKLWKQA